MALYSKLFAPTLTRDVARSATLATPAPARLRPTIADQQSPPRTPTPTAPPTPPPAPERSTPLDRFLAGRHTLTHGADFQSSNPKKPAVYQIRYAPAELSMYVTFFQRGRPGPTYRYWTVDVQEAKAMFMASSKGEAVWDQFRIRGSKNGHRKNYARV